MEMTQTNLEIIDQLKAATHGLLFTSESEYPFEVFLWEAIAPVTPEKVVQQTGHPQDTPVEVVEVENFFRVATTEEEWHTEEEKETVKRYQSLVKKLRIYLSDIKVYRLGHVEIDVYIVGQTPDGKLAGLSTHVVET